MKNEFPIGTEVESVMGCYYSGVVVPPFSLDKCTDGTYKPFDAKTMVACKWDNGTQGFMYKLHIQRKISNREM